MNDNPADTIPVKRVDLATEDMGLLVAALTRMYTEHRPYIRCPRSIRARAAMHTAWAGGLLAGRVGFDNFDYLARFDPPGDLLAGAALDGYGTLTTARERLDCGPGEVFLAPPDQPYAASLCSTRLALLKIPRSAPASLAEETSGLPAADLRFESMAPVSAAAAARWSHTVAFGCRQLIDSDVTEISPLIVQELIRVIAAVLLTTFPNTAMGAVHRPGPGWAPGAAVQRAAAFIDAQAGQPVTVDRIAAAAGVTVRVLQYRFRRQYNLSPIGYLRQVRLDRAHGELRAADPASGVTVRDVARRWGWNTPSQFAATYQRHYGELPGQTLRT